MTNLSEYIAEHFGANANYVEGLLARYKADVNSVDDSWRDFFSNLLNEVSPLDKIGSNGVSEIAPTTTVSVSSNEPIATAKAKAAIALGADIDYKPIVGASKKIVENMEMSLSVPTATSTRKIPVKVLEENRKIINDFLAKTGRGKVSFTHIIAWAIVKAIEIYPRLNHGFVEVNEQPSRVEHEAVNIGLAIDIQKKDGSRNLLVPNIKSAEKLNFAQFFAAYDNIVKRAREGKLTIDDFQGTTISLTNPGTIGTVASNPRLMSGQSVIIATGAIEYPAEYQAMTSGALSQLGISKTLTITSTYDHRIIQGAESGLMLAKIHEFLMGKNEFYDKIFRDIELNIPPIRWAEDYNPSLLGGDRFAEQAEKQANVLQLINAYRIRGHLLADIDPLNMTSQHVPELDLENYGLTI
ncbi:MAG: 2-oxo acid dehydrogenase subunit E2, partial [Acidobacteriota bacterium]